MTYQETGTSQETHGEAESGWASDASTESHAHHGIRVHYDPIHKRHVIHVHGTEDSVEIKFHPTEK
ncbi:MAG TPA: hypothetical protein VGO50_04790 [Pyrinomonadaceae bacterium]|jgi:hypothetical protein|nr:hypothetical protein [Pyrinomonadaceae bacterium]